MGKRKIVWITSICLVAYLMISIFNVSNTKIKAASLDSALGFEWKRNDTMDELLKTVVNKAGDDEAYISWNLYNKDTEEKIYGTYTLEYYLKDKVKTKVTFEHMTDKVIVKYNMLQYDTTKTPGDTGYETSITSDEYDKSFAMMNYDLMVPQLETKSAADKAALVDANGNITFTITAGASSKYPGASFVINNLVVRFRWDMQTKKMSLLTKGVQRGHIVPFHLTIPGGANEKIQLLRAFDNFNIEPTHWINDSGTNKDIESVEIPSGSSIRPGSKPGLRITFNRPKVLNTDSDKLVYETATQDQLKKADTSFINAVLALKDIRDNGNNTDIKLKLDTIASGTFVEPPKLGTGDNSAATYKYNYDGASDTGTYTIELVKDRSELEPTTMLIDFLQWDNLTASSVYTAEITLEESPTYQFHKYEPVNEYAYTYLDYIVKRASMDDAYLDIVPYGGSNADDLEYTIYHSKTEKSSFGEDDIWLKHYHKQEYSDANIYIPVPFENGSTQEYYQVGVQFAGSPLRSQTIKYVPTNDNNVPPPVPRIKEIKNLAVVPPYNTISDVPTKVQFDMVWHAPDKDLLNNMLSVTGSAIYYEVLFNDIPLEESTNKFSVIKVFKVWKDGTDIKVEEFDSGKTKASPSTIAGYSNGYNASENLFEMKNIVIKDSAGWSKAITENDGNKAEPYTKAADSDPEYAYEFPGVNFIRMRSAYIINDINPGGYAKSDRSIADSLSLSMLKYEIPMAGSLSYTPRITTDSVPKVGMNVKFKLIDITNYDNYMLAPLNKTINNITYRIYIAEGVEGKNKILNLESLMTTDAGASKKLIDLDHATEAARETANGVYKIVDTSGDIELTDTEIGYLRTEKILYQDIITSQSDAGFEELKLLNLDPNTNYYIRIVSELGIADSGAPSTVVEKRRSEPSSMLSATSPVVPTNPGDNELVPLAPEKMDATHYDDSMITGKITWEFPAEIVLEEDKYGFELISLENRSLPDTLGSGKMLQDIFDSDLLTGAVIEGWRLYVKGGNYVLKYYDKGTKTWINATQTFEVNGNKITIIDNNNLPNKVYYYYARTIKILSEVPKGASAWVADTLTTAAIKQPINLIVDHNPTYSYDPKREVIIRFDAPVPTDYHTTGNYVMEIFVKGDKDSDYTNTKYTTSYLEQVSGANDGYTRSYYKISGLEPGKTYSIKVRIEDRTKPQDTLPNGTKVYPRSSFSERVSTRTEFDQEDYDKENKYLEYIKYYEDKAQELKKTSYWEVEIVDEKQIIKYREDYNIGELKYASDGKYYLMDTIKGVGEYYLPAKMIETANDKGVMIMVKFSDGEMGIRPYALSKDKTTEIQKKIEEINKYNSPTRDYYVRLTMNSGKYNDKVNGNTPASNLLDVNIQVVGSNIAEADFERLILQKFDEMVASKKTYLMNELDKELESGIDEAKLLKIVTDTLKQVKESHRASVKSLMNTYIQTSYSVVNPLQNTIRIAFNAEDNGNVLQGYKKNGSSWTEVSSDNFGNTYNIETKEVGAYILAPRSSMYDELDTVYNGMVTNLITEYSLTDIFSSGELSNLENKVYKYQLIAATARILGAPKGQEDAEWLAGKNIQIGTSQMYGYMTRDEAMYLFMQAYAAKNDLNLKAINITNYNAIEDISSVDEKYRDTLLKGVNLGIIKLNNGRLLPDDTVVSETVLEMLTRIHNKIDW